MPDTIATEPAADPRTLLITEQLSRRPMRRVDLSAEVAAMQALTGLIATNPADAIQRFLDITLTLCDAGSAGLSLLATAPDGAPIFNWDALAGAFAGFVGGATPADFSPCGLCLEAGAPILIERPARIFTYLRDARPEIVEGLIVPLHDAGRRPLGTLWIVSHDEARRFDGETARQMEQLAALLVLAIRLRIEDRRLSTLLGSLHGQRRETRRLPQTPG